LIFEILLDSARQHSTWGLCSDRGRLTLDLRHVHAEMIALFEYALATLLDEVIEALSKASHAIAQVIEAEFDAGQLVDHGRWVGSEVGASKAACAEGCIEARMARCVHDGCHFPGGFRLGCGIERLWSEHVNVSSSTELSPRVNTNSASVARDLSTDDVRSRVENREALPPTTLQLTDSRELDKRRRHQGETARNVSCFFKDLLWKGRINSQMHRTKADGLLVGRHAPG